ncbi:MAG: YaeQ family protein [Candidatus Melainabacteria bacterium]|nr:YaeQ family protein [Candidatus Melainabacteria bacterium]
MKYSFNLVVQDNKRERSEKLVIPAFSEESGGHVALKLLAYMMFIDQQPHIDEDAGWHFVPDLIARDDSGEIKLWVDCGTVSMKKVDTIATKVRDKIDFFVFRKTKSDMDKFYKAITDKVKHLQNVKCISFDDGFVDGIGAALDRTNDLEGYIADDMVNLTIKNSFGKHDAYSTIHRIAPETDDKY